MFKIPQGYLGNDGIMKKNTPYKKKMARLQPAEGCFFHVGLQA